MPPARKYLELTELRAGRFQRGRLGAHGLVYVRTRRGDGRMMLYGLVYARTSRGNGVFQLLLHPPQHVLPQVVADDGDESRENDHEARGHCGGQVQHDSVRDVYRSATRRQRSALRSKLGLLGREERFMVPAFGHCLRHNERNLRLDLSSNRHRDWHPDGLVLPQRDCDLVLAVCVRAANVVVVGELPVPGLDVLPPLRSKDGVAAIALIHPLQ
mmetsp:Transcript_42288/g.105230  ORF Transcript_42288/g.105230 Transcript_42288/m.105230 type:complete len:214 (+) Transcript_42288:608-1249(+)